MRKRAQPLANRLDFPVGRRQIALVGKFRDGARDRIVQAAVHGPEFVDADLDLPRGGQLSDGLAEVAIIVHDLIDRVSGPMKFRLVLQPIMAAIFAIRSGLKDARAGKTPYLWSLVSDPAHRADMIKDGWKSVGKVFVLALVLDVVYQIIVERFVYPGEAIIVAFVLAILPYLILRGLVTRLARTK